MHISLLQWDTAWEQPEKNFDRVRELLEDRLAVSDPDLVCLPEMFATGFSMNVEEIAEEPDGPTHEFLSDLAREHGMFLQGSAVHRSGDLGENMALIYDPDGTLVCQYSKIHPFSYLDENEHYRSGSEVRTVNINGFTVCPVICFDLRFPEIFRRGVVRGADLFLVPANWPSSRLDHWQTLLRARAIENQAFVVAPNRTGEGNGLRFPGNSMVVDPWGQVRSSMGEEEGGITVEITLDEVVETRQEYPFLRDMKPELIGDPDGKPGKNN